MRKKSLIISEDFQKLGKSRRYFSKCNALCKMICLGSAEN